MAEKASRPWQAGGGVNADAGSVSLYQQDITNPGGAQRGPAHGRVIGQTWVKGVRGSVHMLKAPRGWAVDRGDLAVAESLGATCLEVCDLESGKVYRARLDMLRRKGLSLQRGCGAQVALPLGYWAVDGEPSDAEPAGAAQLGLFEQGRA